MIKDKHIIGTSLMLVKFAQETQVDKNNIPYMYHIYGVWNRLTNYNNFIQALGIMHDLIEDTSWTLEHLKTYGYDKKFIDAMDSLTRRESEKYSDYIIRVSKNKYAKIVKHADLKDNLYRCLMYINLHPNDRKNKSFKSLIKRYENALLDLAFITSKENK